VAGASLNYPERAGDPGQGWVGTLGVRRAWRRRGVGEALLRRSFALLHARGLRKVRLGVDAENLTGATRLYERVGMNVLRRSNTWEREL
jgi:mycothiol synthase